jgi:hypothetical protein
MIGFQDLTPEQQVGAAHIAALGNHTLFEASHIWYADDSQTVVLRLHSGVDVMVEPACEGGYS